MYRRTSRPERTDDIEAGDVVVTLRHNGEPTDSRGVVQTMAPGGTYAVVAFGPGSVKRMPTEYLRPV